MKWPQRSLLVILLLAAIVLSTGRPTQAAPTQNVRVNYNEVVSTITYPFWGVNYVAFWDPIQGSVASREAMRNAGIQLIRFPGGEPANWLDWSKPDSEPYWTTTSSKEMGAYAKAVGAQLLLQTNPTRNAISDSGEKNDPSGTHAADWVRFTNQQQIDAPYWEIGNEPDIQVTNDRDKAALNWYFTAFNQQAAAMKAADPSIKLFGPVGTNAYQWWALHSLDIFLESAGNKQGSGLVDGVSLHYYPPQGCVGWDNVRAVAQDWPRFMAQIKSVIATYDTRSLPVFISETNAAVGGMNCEIVQTMASALANADLAGAYRSSGVQAVQFFGAIHGGGSGWGLLYAANEARSADTPTPTYFMFPIWTRSGNQVLSVGGVSDPEATLSVYASKKPDGSVQVVAINKTASPLPLNVGFNGFNPAGKALSIYELKPAAGGIWDKDVIYNGVRAPAVSGASLPPPLSERVSGTSYTRTLPAYSLTLLDFGAGTGGNQTPTPVTPTPTTPGSPSPPPPPAAFLPFARR